MSKPPVNQEELKDILRQFYFQAREDDINPFSNDTLLEAASVITSIISAQQRALLDVVQKEVIGDRERRVKVVCSCHSCDILYEKTGELGTTVGPSITRNNFRADQEHKLKELREGLR